MNNRSINILAFSAVAILLPFAVFALSGSDNFTLKITPGTPGPNQPVVAETISYSIDINGSIIVWRINDKIVASGIGVKKIDFKTGPAGSITKIQVDVTSTSGNTISQSITLPTHNIDLLWHADSYTPPYYSGKGLLATKSAVTVTAIPHLFKNGQKLAPDSLIYEWRLDDWNLADKSGYNRQALTFIADGFSVHRSHLIEVTVSDRERTTSTKKSLTLTPGKTDILFYANNPLSGPLYNKAVVAITLPPGIEKQFIAIPYYFALAGLESLTYVWRVNGGPDMETPPKPYLFGFRSLSDTGGSVNVGLQISSKLHPTQSASSQINITVQ